MRAYPSTLILMVVTVASFKGGVGKSTTAIHLAAYLQALAPALLVDGDPNRSVSEWARAGDFRSRSSMNARRRSMPKNSSTSLSTQRRGLTKKIFVHSRLAAIFW